MERFLDAFMDAVGDLLLAGTLVVMAGIFLIGLPVFAYCAWQDSRSPIFELRKDEWVCTASHDETRTTMVLVGKVLVPMVSTETVCDRWERRR